MASDPNLQKEFLTLLDTLGFPEAKRKELLKLPDADKKTLISQYKKKETPPTENEALPTRQPSRPTLMSSGSAMPSTAAGKSPKAAPRAAPPPKTFVNSVVGGSASLEDLVKLRVELNTAPVNWVMNFLSTGGLAGIQKILGEVQAKRKKTIQDQSIELECVRCIHACMTAPAGLEMLAQAQQVVNLLMLTMDAGQVKTKVIVVQLLSALTQEPNGHAAVIAAIKNFKDVKKELHLGGFLVKSLREDKNLQYLTECIAFINCIVSSPSMNVLQKAEIRKGFINAGILEVFKQLRHQNSEELDTQINVFQEEMEEDEQERSLLHPTSIDPLEALKSLVDPSNSESVSTFLNLITKLKSKKQLG